LQPLRWISSVDVLKAVDDDSEHGKKQSSYWVGKIE
jgi:hypothetical protein